MTDKELDKICDWIDHHITQYIGWNEWGSLRIIDDERFKEALKDAISKQQQFAFVFPFGTLCANVLSGNLFFVRMTDIDFIRLSALVFATRLIGKTTDPISEGTEMAERLFNKLKEKEEQ